jgi:hypothetical protein
MPGSIVVISPEQMNFGWISLQYATRQAWQCLHDASDIQAVADSFTSLSRCRLLSFAQPMLLRGQRLERLTAGALLGHPEMALIGDKDVDSYRIWHLMPLTPPAKAILSAVVADLDLLQLKCAELNIDLHRQLGKRGGQIPRRTTLFFGLRVDSGTDRRIKRVGLKKGDLDALAAAHFGQPANAGRHFFVNELLLAGVDVQAIVAATNHAHVGAEPFADSGAVAPEVTYKTLVDGLRVAIGVLGENTVAGPFSSHQAPRLAPARAPNVQTDPYLHPQVQQGDRILPPAFDCHTLVALDVVSQVWSTLTSKARVVDLGIGEATLCAAALDGFHPFDLKDARIPSAESTHTLGQALCLVFARRDHAAEISAPLCPRTVLAIEKAVDRAIGTSEQMQCAGHWLQRSFAQVIWPADAGEAFLAFCALCARWHRFHIEPSTLAAASRAVPSAAANRESMLRLADARCDWTASNETFSPVRSSSGRRRVRIRAALAEIRTKLSHYGDTCKSIGEEQQRARDLKKDLAGIDVQGDYPAMRAKENLSIECDLWLEQRHRAVKAGRQFSSLSTYGPEFLAGLQLLHVSDDPADWCAPDFLEWYADVKTHLAKPSDPEPELFGLSRFLLIGRDYLGWDVPDTLLRGQSFVAKDGLRKSAAASLTFSFDYTAARPLVARRLEGWPLIRETALLALDFREQVPSRSGERCTLPADCLTSRSNRLVFQNQGYSNIKSSNGVRLCQINESLAEKFRARSRRPEANGDSRSHLFLDSDGDDWTAIDAAEQVINDAMVTVTGDPSYRPHSSRGFMACNLSWDGWEAAARGLFDGHPVSAAIAWAPAADASRIVRAALSMGVGHANTLLVYYSANWPLLRAIAVNRLLAKHEPSTDFVAEALGNTQAVRAAKSRAERKTECFSAWDVIGRISVVRAGIPVLVRKQPFPVIAPRTSQPASVPTAQTIACYVLARKTGSSREAAADRHGIPIQHAQELDSRMEDPDE